MERKAFVIFILLLSSLAVLAIIHFGQQAPLPVPSPTASPITVVSVKPYLALENMANNTTRNATVTPTPTPATQVKHTQSPAQQSTPTPQPYQMTPTAMPRWEPMDAWDPMKPWDPARRMTPMPPLSWE